MPFYRNSPPEHAILIEQGWPVYLFGSRQSIDAELQVTSVAVATNVATVAVTSGSGPLPVVGSFASITGSQNGAGEFNVTNLALTAVTLNATHTDIVSVSFALTHADLSAIADIGTMHVRFAPIGEAFSAAGASIAGSVNTTEGRYGNVLTAQVYFPTAPAGATIALQGANRDNDADYVDIVAIPITSGRGFAQVESNFEFVRFNITAVTGSGTVVASINA